MVRRRRVNEPKCHSRSRLRVHECLRRVTRDVHIGREQQIAVEVGWQLEVPLVTSQHTHRQEVEIMYTGRLGLSWTKARQLSSAWGTSARCSAVKNSKPPSCSA